MDPDQLLKQFNQVSGLPANFHEQAGLHVLHPQGGTYTTPSGTTLTTSRGPMPVYRQPRPKAPAPAVQTIIDLGQWLTGQSQTQLNKRGDPVPTVGSLFNQLFNVRSEVPMDHEVFTYQGHPLREREPWMNESQTWQALHRWSEAYRPFVRTGLLQARGGNGTPLAPLYPGHFGRRRLPESI